ncbi:MAG: carbohydrate ABC transporter permease [Candidatus Fimadaptatus sp.]|jgi:multiple sugar transport system permease protein
MIAMKTHSMKRRKVTLNVVYHVLVTAASIGMLYPLIWMISSSFKPNAEIFDTVGQLIPETLTLENYVNGWRGFAGLSFSVYFKNSLIIAGLSTIGAAFSAAVVAFGLARLHFPGRNFWFVTMIITMMLPSQVMMIPRFVLFNSIGWVGSYLPLVVPAFFGSAFDIFLVMQFIRGIPRDMDEAATIDGCSWYGIFWRIMLPMIVPAVVTVGILTFIGAWGDFMGSLLYLNAPQTYTVAYALKLFSDSAGTDFGATFAMSVLSLVPILIIFFFFQRQLVEGISIQGLKG